MRPSKQQGPNTQNERWTLSNFWCGKTSYYPCGTYVRNNILHRSANKNKERESEQLTEKITWYLDHKTDLLSFHDQFLANTDLSTIHRATRESKRMWVQHLDIAREAYENERRQLASKQNVITRYFNPVVSEEQSPDRIPPATHCVTPVPPQPSPDLTRKT